MSSSEAPDLQQQQEHDSSDEEYYDTGAGTGQEDEEEEQEGEALCQCEQIYQDSGNEKKVLYLLSIGLKGNNGPLFSLEQEPWSLLPKNSLRPKNNDYVKEITRRSKAYSIQPMPRPSNWTRQQITDWLERNPIHDVADIAFLTKEVRRVQDVLTRAQLAQAPEGNNRGFSESATTVMSRRNWRGSIPYLRIIMCLTHDHVKSLFLDRANARSRQEIDGRNCENRYVERGLLLFWLLVLLMKQYH
jgi:hypothetical protein